MARRPDFRPRRIVILLGVAALACLGAAWWRIDDFRAAAALVRADPDRILADPRSAAYARIRGRKVFARSCAACHGAEGHGSIAPGVPDLTDRDALYETARVSDVEAIVRHGIRSGDRQAKNLADMPAYAHAAPYARYTLRPLSPREVEDLTQFLLGYSGRETDRDAANRGGIAFAQGAGCYDCHLRDARGDAAIGAPDLTDAIWLYGGSPAAIRRSIEEGRAGHCPAFERRLSPADIRAVAAYTVSLAPRRKTVDE